MANKESAEDIVNRLYYVAREAALAVLAHIDVNVEKMPRTHRGLGALFHRKVVEKGLMDPKWNRELSRLQSDREDGDYRQIGDSELESSIGEMHMSVLQFVELVRKSFVPNVAPFESRLDPENEEKEPGD